MPPLILVDVWLLLGAVIQLCLVLRARNFLPRDWLVPLLALLGGSIGWFFFIRICSQDFGPAADAFIIGYGMALSFGAIYVSAFAPMRLNSATLLSLTISFWAVYWSGGVEHKWLYPAIAMTAAALAFAAGRGRGSLPFRAALQIWSLTAAALVAYDGIPSRVATVLKDYRKEETAHTLGPLEVLVTGAQFFLFAQMGTALILLMYDETWTGWLPAKGFDESLGWPALAALVVQGAAFILLRKSGGDSQSQFMSLALFAALAHGAMTGPDAKSSPPVVDKSFEPFA
jgi:hypothetical protein